MARRRQGNGHPVIYYLRNFRFHSVLFRYYVLVFLFFYVPFVAAVIGVTTHYSNRVREQIETTYSTRVEQAQNAVSSALKGAEVALFRFSRSDELAQLVEADVVERPGYDTLLRYTSATNELAREQSAFAIFYLISPQQGFWVNSESARGRLEESSSPVSVDGLPEGEADWFQIQYQRDSIRVLRPVLQSVAGLTNGVVMASLQVDAILESAGAANLGDRHALLLLSPSGAVVGTQEVGVAPEFLAAVGGPRSGDLGRGQFDVVSWERDEFAVFSNEVHRGFVVSAFVPTERFLSTIRTTNRAIFIFAGIMGILMIPLVFAIAVHLYNPVKQLFELAEETERATRSDPQVGRNYDEIRFITDNMARSVDRQRELESELERRVAMLNQAQVLALQSQISPHFLNNTLSTISWLAMSLTGGENEATRVVNDLSSLLRSTLESDTILTTIRDELAHAHTYIAIQKVRYKRLLEVRWEVPDDLLDEQIVRVTLQPLLENAIYHGVKPKKRGTIVVRGARAEGLVFLEVADDGVGISQERAHKLNVGFEAQYAVADDHIGLGNVNQRLRLVFGAEYGLSIRPGEPTGAVVKITLPEASQQHLVTQQSETHPTYS